MYIFSNSVYCEHSEEAASRFQHLTRCIVFFRHNGGQFRDESCSLENHCIIFGVRTTLLKDPTSFDTISNHIKVTFMRHHKDA